VVNLETTTIASSTWQALAKLQQLSTCWTGLNDGIGGSGSISLLALLENLAKEIIYVATMEGGSRTLFAVFEAKVTSKLCSPGNVKEGSNNNLCFVELADGEQDQAIVVLNRPEKGNSELKVTTAHRAGAVEIEVLIR